MRPNGLDVGSALKDTWVLEWPGPDAADRPLRPRHFHADWRERDWGEITNQDYENMEHIQVGMQSFACTDLRFNERQEQNLLHMHRVIDRYLLDGSRAPVD